jgi:hypothetical protein
MSPEGHATDLADLATQADYCSTGNEENAIYRYTGRNNILQALPLVRERTDFARKATQPLV